jgi:hypothetical protein
MGTVRVLGRGGERLSKPPAHASTGHETMDMDKSKVTSAQVNAVAVLTVVTLVAGLVIAGAFGNFSA